AQLTQFKSMPDGQGPASKSGFYGFANRQQLSFTGIERLTTPPPIEVVVSQDGTVAIPTSSTVLQPFGPPHVLAGFFPTTAVGAFSAGFEGDVRVAVGDVNGDGILDTIVAGGPGIPGGHIEVFDGRTAALMLSFLSFPGYTGGVFVASGD